MKNSLISNLSNLLYKTLPFFLFVIGQPFSFQLNLGVRRGHVGIDRQYAREWSVLVTFIFFAVVCLWGVHRNSLAVAASAAVSTAVFWQQW